MIAKPDWFVRRKYTGWGLTPRTWQGWVYVLLMGGMLAVIQSLPLANNLKMIITAGWAVFFLIDTLLVMAAIKMDEMERRIEAIAERNASWTMVAAILVELIYILTAGSKLAGAELVPAVILPIAAGAMAKGITSYILGKRGI